MPTGLTLGTTPQLLAAADAPDLGSSPSLIPGMDLATYVEAAISFISGRLVTYKHLILLFVPAAITGCNVGVWAYDDKLRMELDNKVIMHTLRFQKVIGILKKALAKGPLTKERFVKMITTLPICRNDDCIPGEHKDALAVLVDYSITDPEDMFREVVKKYRVLLNALSIRYYQNKTDNRGAGIVSKSSLVSDKVIDLALPNYIIFFISSILISIIIIVIAPLLLPLPQDMNPTLPHFKTFFHLLANFKKKKESREDDENEQAAKDSGGVGKDLEASHPPHQHPDLEDLHGKHTHFSAADVLLQGGDDVDEAMALLELKDSLGDGDANEGGVSEGGVSGDDLESTDLESTSLASGNGIPASLTGGRGLL